MEKDKIHTEGSQETWSPKTNQVCDCYEYLLVLTLLEYGGQFLVKHKSRCTAKEFFKRYD